MALRPSGSQHAPSRLSTGATQKSPGSGAFKEGALFGPGISIPDSKGRM